MAKSEEKEITDVRGLLKSSTDWNNLDLESERERNLPILESYAIEDILLEISCNLPLIDKDAVLTQTVEFIMERANEAIEIVELNLDNIVKYAQKERDL